MKVWISRNQDLFVRVVSIYTERPIYQSGVFVNGVGGDFITGINISNFKTLFGFTPRKGRCEEVELNLIRKNINKN